MKILIYFSGHLSEPKGTPIRTRNMIVELLKNGATVFYAGQDVPENVPRERVLLLKPPLVRGFQLARFVRQNQIDIVYFQTSAGLWFAPFVRLLTHAASGVDFHSRRFQEEHVYQKRARLHTAFLEFVELLLCRFLSFGTSVSGTISDYHRASVPNMLTLPVGVDVSLFSPDTSPDKEVLLWKGDAMLLAYAGNTKWYQGLGTVLEAFKRLHNEKPGSFKFLVIASSGADEVREYAKKHNLTDAILVLDKRPHDAIPSLLVTADILTVVRPSDMITEYSFPSKLPEYAALGKALVVSKVSDVTSYIMDHENGLVVPPGDSNALYEALKELENTKLRERLGHTARELALKCFAIDVLGAKLYNFLMRYVQTH